MATIDGVNRGPKNAIAVFDNPQPKGVRILELITALWGLPY
jgi:hypothetical protein